MENFIEHGFRHFYFSVNYRDEMIREYFGDGARWGAEIRYVKETRKMGTAGSLGLLPSKPQHTLLVMNGDLLTKVNFSQLLRFHKENKAEATMCVREYDFQVPFGVVTLDKFRIRGIDEKPAQRFFVNAGIYVLEPGVLLRVPKGVASDMPQLFEKIIKHKRTVAAFPIREYWLDIGQLEDFRRANGEFSAIFKNR